MRCGVADVSDLVCRVRLLGTWLAGGLFTDVFAAV